MMYDSFSGWVGTGPIGAEYLESDTIIVADVHSFSSPNDPIVFLLGTSVEEPSSDLTKLADLQGIASSKVCPFSFTCK